MLTSAPRVLRLALAPVFALLVSAGCGERHPPEQPVELTNEACCKATSPDMQRSAGCRATGKCKKDEPIWMRGAVTCGPYDPENCLGGRCCKYRPLYGSDDAVFNWDDPEAPPPAATEPGPAPESAPTSESAPAPTPEPAPEPEPEPAPEG